MQNPWLSVIIPAYNCIKTIDRLLWSIINQGDLYIEVIICDDSPNDDLLKYIDGKYNNLLDINYCRTIPREIHCPGNTRLDGWKYAKGEWITFIDHDDEFEPYTFSHVKEWIISRDEKRFVYSLLRGFNPTSKEYTKSYDAITWMHGKFYNRQWLIDNNINFKENLFANEDLYFNTLVHGTILCSELDEYTRADHYTYKWFEEPTSLSRSMKNNNYTYTEVYFEDYIIASTEPWFNLYETHKDFKDLIADKVYYNFLHCYLYYQFFLWKYEKTGIKPLDTYIPLITKLYHKICDTFNVTGDDIINTVYSNKNSGFYDKVKDAIVNSTDPFIEYTSFKDFVKGIE